MSTTQPEQEALASAQDTLKDIQSGNLPSNDAITKGISEMQEAAAENKSQLSKQGQMVLADTDRLLETIKHLVDDKNSDEYIQKAFSEAYEATDKEDIEVRRQKIKQIVLSAVNSEKSRDEAAKGVDSLMTIVRLMVSSPEFRDLINDLETIFEQAFVVDADRTTHGSSVTSPQNSKSMLAGTDPAAPSNFGTSYRFGQSPSAVTNPNYDPFHLESNTAEAYFGANSTKIDVAGVTAGDATTSISTEQAQQEAEDTLIDHYARIAHTLNEHPEYRNAINYLMDSVSDLSDYIEQKANKLEDVHEKEAGKSQNQEADAHAREAWANGKHFLENWVGPEYSLDEFLDSINDLANKAKNDDELAAYIKEVRDFFEKSAADKSYVQDEERVKADARQRIRKGRELAQGKYKNEFEKLKKEFEFLNDGIQSDEGVQQLEADFQQLMSDLFLDENGNATLHMDLLRDLQVMIPALIKKFRRLPLPDIDLGDDEMDLTITNAVLDCADIAPSHFEFILRADTEETRVRNVIQVTISKIRARVLGADFVLDKKTFPKVQESGKADLSIFGKNGMTIAFEICPWDLENSAADAPALKLRKNICKISKLNLRLRKTEHDILYSLLSPIINAMVKTKIEEVMKDNLRVLIEDGSKQAQQTATAQLEQAKQAAKDN